MNRYKLTLEYDGSAFCGWQKQANAIALQEVVEKAIREFTGHTTETFVAGRTDAGVHALGQVIHFDLEKDFEAATVQNAINHFLRPHRISVMDVAMVSETFHARFDAKFRSYRYLVINRRAPLALMAGRAWHYPKPLELEPMQRATGLLIGHHDFSTFRAANCQANSPMRTLDKLEVRREGDMFIFDVRARSFLYHQVRNMVGTLIMVGSGAWSVADFDRAFKAADRASGGPTAPPEGLYFLQVEYE